MNNFYVIKDSGEKEEFSLEKLKNSLRKAHATEEEISAILLALQPQLCEGISSKRIYQEAFKLLRNYSRAKASRYNLKRGLMEFGPTGFPFERFVGELFKHKGYIVELDTIVQGKCISHEVDVIAKKATEIIFVECKYRNQTGFSVDVKNPLYIYARFQDILDNGLLTNKEEKFMGCIATNTKFTEDATKYANCKGLQLISWNYPINNSLKDIIDESGLYPLTCLTALTKNEKQTLLAKGYILVREIYNQVSILRSVGVKESRLNAILKEGEQLCVI